MLRPIKLPEFLCNCHQAFSIRSISVHVVPPYSSIDLTAACKKNYFILSDRSEFHMTDSLSMPSLVTNWCRFPYMRRCFRGRWTCPEVSKTYDFSMETSPLWLKLMNSVLSAVIKWHMLPAAHSRLYKKISSASCLCKVFSLVGQMRGNAYIYIYIYIWCLNL